MRDQHASGKAEMGRTAVDLDGGEAEVARMGEEAGVGVGLVGEEGELDHASACRRAWERMPRMTTLGASGAGRDRREIGGLCGRGMF